MLPSFKTYLGQQLRIRKYIRVLAITIVLFLVYHAAIWYFFTAKLLETHPPERVGDLARIGYQINSMYPRVDKITLSKKHIEFPAWKGEQIDILTIGDSFSNGGGGGTNRYYQDFLSTKFGYTVMNINPSLFGENYIEAVVALLNSGLLEEIKPKTVLIESVGRYVVSRFAKPINWDQNLTKNQVYADLKNGHWGDGKPQQKQTSFITTANYKFPLYNSFYLFSPNAFNHSNVYKLPLNKPFFHVKAPSTLLVFKHDITSINGVTPKNISMVNENLNHLSSLLQTKKVSLYFMIAVDKYDLYSAYIPQKYLKGKNPLFDLIRPMNKNYTFIDTKAILANKLQEGTLDVFFADDTHWNSIASDAVTSDNAFISPGR